MHRKLSILLGLLLLLLSACSSNTFTFSSEIDNWSATLEVTQISNDFEEQEFELQYRGNEASNVGDISFNVETNAGGFGGSNYRLDENGAIRISEGANPTNAKISEGSEVEVTVEWNDNTETIILSNN